MNWQIFSIALACGLLGFPISTRHASMSHKYAVVICQMVTAISLGFIVPLEHTSLVAVAVFSKHLADLASWVIGYSVDKVLVKRELRKVLHG